MLRGPAGNAPAEHAEHADSRCIFGAFHVFDGQLYTLSAVDSRLMGNPPFHLTPSRPRGSVRQLMSVELVHSVAKRAFIGQAGTPRASRMYWRKKSGRDHLGMQKQNT